MMTRIRVDPTILHQEAEELAAAAPRLASAGDQISQTTDGAPDYEGQFGPQVSSIGAEIASQARGASGALADLAASLVAKAAAFQAADAVGVAGFETLAAQFGAPSPPAEALPWWAPFVLSADNAWKWYDENVNARVYQAMGGVADSLRSIGDSERNPRMAAFHQMLWNGLSSWGDIFNMWKATVEYTTQATRDGRWSDAARGSLALAQEDGALASGWFQAQGIVLVGIVTTPMRVLTDIPQFGSAISERLQGKDRGWDVIFTGTMLAGDLSATYALAKPMGLVDSVNQLQAPTFPQNVEAGLQVLERYQADIGGRSVAGLIRGRGVPVQPVEIEGVDVAGGISGPGGKIIVTADPNYAGSTAATLYEEVYHAFQRGGTGLEVELGAKSAMARWITQNGISDLNPYTSADIRAFQAGWSSGGMEGGTAALRQWLIQEGYPGINETFGPGLLYWSNVTQNLWVIAAGIPHGALPVTPAATPTP
jgi:uncharacterized protein YukE